MLGLGGADPMSGIIDIAAGWQHSLAVFGDHTVAAWGLNTSGQLGVEAPAYSPLALFVQDSNGMDILRDVVAISAGDDYSLAVTSAGAGLAWRNNYAGQLGDGTTTNSFVPVMITGPGF